MFAPPPESGNTPSERVLRSVLLRKSLPGLPPEIVTEDTLRWARIYQSGSCAVIAVMSALLTWYASTLLTSGTGVVFLIGGLGGWVLASFPGLILAVLAFDGASKDELPAVVWLTTINGLLVLLFFYLAGQFAPR